MPWLTYGVLILGVVIIGFPVWVAIAAATQSIEQVRDVPMSMGVGAEFFNNLRTVLDSGAGNSAAPVGRMVFNTFVVALVIAVGKIVISILSAYAFVFFRFPGRTLAFWLIFITLMLPVEVRIMPTYEVMASLNLINTYTGLTLPLIASATATFLFRQFFMTIPPSLVDAARIDGASPMRFFFDVLLPLSRTNIAALFVITFTYGWNQYLWPLLTTTDESMYTVVVGIKRMLAGNDAVTEWHLVMVTALLAMLPPVLVVVGMQRWFVKGLVDSDK
jgi:sn-glycerol 3-phosphate transport system permease protein